MVKSSPTEMIPVIVFYQFPTSGEMKLSPTPSLSLRSSVVDLNPKESEGFGRIRIQIQIPTAIK
jgi:hypothetical protein